MNNYFGLNDRSHQIEQIPLSSECRLWSNTGMKQVVLATVIALLTASVSYAETYQVELEGGYTSIESDFDDIDLEPDGDGWELGATYYFSPVNTDKGPLAEAAFLDRASEVSIGYSDSEVDLLGGKLETDAYLFGGRFVDISSGWTFSANYTAVEDDILVQQGQNLFALDTEIDIWALSVGKYIGEGTEVYLSYANRDVDLDVNEDSDTYSLGIKHVATLSGQMYYAVDASVDFVDEGSDDGEVWNGAFTLYPLNHLGVGVSISYADFDVDNTETYSVFGRWFVTQQLALSLSYDMEEVEDNNFETDIVSAGATLRF
ncbi:MAG: putative porin [Exilibacterium sp.]